MTTSVLFVRIAVPREFAKHGAVTISSPLDPTRSSPILCKNASGLWGARSLGPAVEGAEILLILKHDYEDISRASGVAGCLFLPIRRPECDADFRPNPHAVLLRFANPAGEVIFTTVGDAAVSEKRNVNWTMSPHFHPPRADGDVEIAPGIRVSEPSLWQWRGPVADEARLTELLRAALAKRQCGEYTFLLEGCHPPTVAADICAMADTWLQRYALWMTIVFGAWPTRSPLSAMQTRMRMMGYPIASRQGMVVVPLPILARAFQHPAPAHDGCIEDITIISPITSGFSSAHKRLFADLTHSSNTFALSQGAVEHLVECVAQAERDDWCIRNYGDAQL